MASLLIGAPSHPSSGVGSIGVLLVARRPPAVSGLIALRVVDAIDRMIAGRPFTHVCNEVQEVAPFFADGNSSRAVLRIGRVARVLAPAVHGGPCRVRDRSGKSMLEGASSLAGIASKFGFGFVRMLSAKAAGARITKLPGILDVMLSALASVVAFHAGPDVIGKSDAGAASANPSTSLGSERLVSVAGTIRLAARALLSGVPAACAAGLAFSHAPTIAYRRVLLLECGK